MSGVGSVERSVLIWRKLVLKGLADNREEGLARSLNLEVSMIGVQAGDVVASCWTRSFTFFNIKPQARLLSFGLLDESKVWENWFSISVSVENRLKPSSSWSYWLSTLTERLWSGPLAVVRFSTLLSKKAIWRLARSGFGDWVFPRETLLPELFVLLDLDRLAACSLYFTLKGKDAMLATFSKEFSFLKDNLVSCFDLILFNIASPPKSRCLMPSG